jgi:hypothetical protein
VAQYDEFVDQQCRPSPPKRLATTGAATKEGKKRRCRCETWVSLPCKRLLCLRNGALEPKVWDMIAEWALSQQSTEARQHVRITGCSRLACRRIYMQQCRPL